jgi:hypothetical protein
VAPSHHDPSENRGRLCRIREILALDLADDNDTLDRIAAVLATEDAPEPPPPVETDERGWPKLRPDPDWTDTGTGAGYSPDDPRDPRD